MTILKAGKGVDKCCFSGVAILQRSIRLYAPFYSSDILIASPLGLRTIIGGEGEKKRDFDFLSSIELLIIDQADIYLMQNWEHVLVMLGFPCGDIGNAGLPWGQHPCSVHIGRSLKQLFVAHLSQLGEHSCVSEIAHPLVM